MAKHLSGVRVEFNKDKLVKNMNASQKNNKEGLEHFKKTYSKLLFKKVLEDLADSISTSVELEEQVFEAIKDKMNELNDSTFNLKIIKLLKEELEGQTKLDISRLVESRSIVTMEKFMEAGK